MKKIVIIGGGFAGLWAAFSAIRHAKLINKENDISITLINKDPYHGLRPRFYENELENTRVPLENWLNPLGVKLVVDKVNHINHATQKIQLKTTAEMDFDRLVLASGSHLTKPKIPGLQEYGFNIDTFVAAKKLRMHIDSLPNQKGNGQYTVVVAGGGFTGIEAATNIMDRLKKVTPKNKKPRVIVLDRSQIASQFSKDAQQVIFDAFNDMGIETMANVTITAVHHDQICLSNDKKIPTQTLIWTAGMQSNGLTKQFGLTLDHFGRLPVDRYLRIQGAKNCFAAGDAAAATTDGKHAALLSCQHAMPQGRFCGHNVIADLFNKTLLMYEQLKYVTCLDLGSWGAFYAEGWDQKIVNIKDAAKKVKLFINHNRIYPPNLNENDIEDLLDAAEPIFKPIKL